MRSSFFSNSSWFSHSFLHSCFLTPSCLQATEQRERLPLSCTVGSEIMSRDQNMPYHSAFTLDICHVVL